MKTTQPKKKERQVGSNNKMTTKITVGGKVKVKPGDGSEFPEIDKFETNKFTKKWQQELLTDDVIESANQVKSWNKYGIGMQVVSLWSIMIAFVLGFIVCAIVLTPLVINSI